MFDRVCLQHLENLVAVGRIGLVSGGAQRTGWGVGHQLQVVAGLLRQVHKILIDDAAHTVAGTVDMGNVVEAPRLQRNPYQRLVDHGSGAAALCDKNFSGSHGVCFLVKSQLWSLCQ